MIHTRGLKKPKRDIRDLSLFKAKKKNLFGSTSLSQLPPGGLQRLRPVSIRNQGATNECTGYTATSMRRIKFNREFSPDWFCMQENAFERDRVWKGASLRTQARISCGKGVLPVELEQQNWQTNGEEAAVEPGNWATSLEQVASQFKARSFWTCDGPFDTFDNIRTALYQHDLEGYGVSVGISWFPYDWSAVPNGILPVPASKFSFGHNIRVYDWTLIDGVPYLVFENYEGEEWGDKGIGYIPRAVANKFIFTNEGPYIFIDYDPADAKAALWSGFAAIKDALARLLNLFIK